MGDMFHLNEHSLTQEFVDSLFSHMFYPLINRPTRLKAHSATVIDIFTNIIYRLNYLAALFKPYTGICLHFHTVQSSPVHENRNNQLHVIIGKVI